MAVMAAIAVTDLAAGCPWSRWSKVAGYGATLGGRGHGGCICGTYINICVSSTYHLDIYPCMQLLIYASMHWSIYFILSYPIQSKQIKSIYLITQSIFSYLTLSYLTLSYLRILESFNLIILLFYCPIILSSRYLINYLITYTTVQLSI